MKTNIRIAVSAALIIIALGMGIFTLTGISETAEASAQTISYVLGESDGRLAVFRQGNMKDPVTVTNIELESLREADRNIIRTGLVVSSETELLQLLEDLGS